MRGELALIEEIRRKSLHQKGFVGMGIGDDAAVLRPRRGEELVVTTDFSLESIHFASFHPPFSVGYRCLARGISDVAAMGGRPLAAFLSLALSPEWAQNSTNVREFLRGLHSLAAQFEVVLAGGDTASAPGEHTVADIIVIGAVPRGKALLRSGARPGDRIYVTGGLGGAAAELEDLRTAPESFRKAKPSGSHPHLFPQPRVTAGRRLVGLVSSCMDISDGISTDLRHLCKASGVGANIYAELLPVAAGATLEQALHGGEDYELLFTSHRKIPRKLGGIPVTEIGIVMEDPAVRLTSKGKTKLLRRGGWEHLKRR